ncbi:MAG: type II toxin-antitoxin system RelE family toxin [Actinomycetes bacterium]
MHWPAGPVGDYELRWSPPAIRQLDRLAATSPRVIGAIVEFCFGRLLANPRRAGHALERELTGWRSARVGAYRTIFWIDEGEQTVTVDRVDHRSDVYRPR